MNFNVKLYSRSKNLYIEYYQNGVRTRRSLKLADNKKNRSHVEKVMIPHLILRLINGEILDFKETVTKSKSFSEYLDFVLSLSEDKKPATLRTYNALASVLRDYFVKPIESYKITDIEVFISELKAQKRSSSTISVICALLSLCFKYALRDGVITSNPVSLAIKPTVKNQKKFSYTFEQVKYILANSSGKLQVFLYIAFFTGMRSGEILALKWSDIDFEKNIISVNGTVYVGTIVMPKTNEVRKIVLFDELKNYLMSLSTPKLGYIFTRNGFDVYVDNSTFNKAFKILLHSLSLPISTLHVTRHTFASLMIQSGADMMLIRDMLGHGSLEMINKTYGHYLYSSEPVKLPFGK